MILAIFRGLQRDTPELIKTTPDALINKLPDSRARKLELKKRAWHVLHVSEQRMAAH